MSQSLNVLKEKKKENVLNKSEAFVKAQANAVCFITIKHVSYKTTT
jgi:hypothetical protein